MLQTKSCSTLLSFSISFISTFTKYVNNKEQFVAVGQISINSTSGFFLNKSLNRIKPLNKLGDFAVAFCSPWLPLNCAVNNWQC